MSADRTPLVAGNWKMNKTPQEARAWGAFFRDEISTLPADVEVAVCPPFPALEATCDALAGTNVWVGAQAVHENASGAHTGEVSAAMIAGSGARGVIVGHSERRAAGETDVQVAARVRAGLDAGLFVILCCGESLQQREAGQTNAHVTAQVNAALSGIDRSVITHLAIAYEPIWAIGTGKTATPEMAQETCAQVRAAAAAHVDGGALRVLYGGSVSPGNAADLMAQPDIDGALVGGASLDPSDFAAIVRGASAGG